VHALPAPCKIVAQLGFVLVVVATPPERFWAFGAYAVLLLAVVALSRLPALLVLLVLRRMTVEVPFVLVAVLLPFVALGPTVQVLGLELSRDGLLGAWNILAKRTLGVLASVVLSATTDARALLAGLERLRVPALLVQIATFMLRYSEVVVAEMRRMKVARESRGFRARTLCQAPVIAHSAGALFIRTYERGERVHLAMLSRGYSGRMPALDSARISRAPWSAAALLPAVAALVALSACWTP
jgi:cobalt/nickel transport system permease protein